MAALSLVPVGASSHLVAATPFGECDCETIAFRFESRIVLVLASSAANKSPAGALVLAHRVLANVLVLVVQSDVVGTEQRGRIRNGGVSPRTLKTELRCGI